MNVTITPEIMSELKKHFLVALAYLFIGLILFFPLVLNITSFAPGYGGDTFQGLWELWWVPYAMFTLHTNVYFTSYVYYPVGASLVTETLAPLSGLLSWPFQLISLPFAYNVLFFVGLALAGLFTYMLAFHVTKNKYGSFLAGFIYAFSPMHIVQAFGHLQWVSIEFIPLFILAFLMMIKEKKLRYSLVAAVSFVLLTFMGDLEQSVLAGLFAIFIILYYALRKEERHMLGEGFWMQFGIMIVAMLIIGSPFIIPLLQGLSHGALNTNLQTNAQYNLLYSPDVLSFFIPSYLNGLLGGIPNADFSIFAPAPSERVVYIGYSVLLLVLYAIYIDYKHHKLKNIGLWVVIAVIFLLLTLGPTIQIASIATPIPGLFDLYNLIPVLSYFREPGRFDIAAELALAVLAAVGFAALENREKKLTKNPQTLFWIFLIVMLIEYEGMPLSTNGVLSNATIPKAYYQLGNFSSNFTMLMLPTLPNPNSQTPNLYPGMAMYYATALKKPIVGGYTTRTNTSQQLILQALPLTVEAGYLEQGQNLTYLSPIVENFTTLADLNLFWLASYHVAFISVLRPAYNITQLTELGDYLAGIFGQPKYQDNTTIIFQTTNATSQVGKNMIEYTSGTWLPGWYICEEDGASTCNTTFSDMWWGNSTRGVVIYAPANKTSTTMHFYGQSNGGISTVYVYSNNDQNPIAVFNFTNAVEGYQVEVPLRQGLNGVVMTSQSTAGQSGTSDYGIENITFK